MAAMGGAMNVSVLWLVSAAVVLVGCSGGPPNAPEPAGGGPTAPVAEDGGTPGQPPVLVPAPPLGPASRREFSLDAPGGLNNAPEGLNFVIPDAAAAQAASGPLSDGSVGFTLTATAPSDAVVCTQPKALAPSVSIEARLKVKAVQPGSQPFMGMNVEVRARDDAGSLVSPAEGRYIVVENIREAGEFRTVKGSTTLPAGASRGEVCFRFLESTGTVEVDSLAIDGLLAEGVAAGIEQIPPPTKRFDLDGPGGGSGAPDGADFLIPKGASGVTTHTGEIAGTHASGFSLDVTQAGDALVCSRPFDVVGDGKVWAQGSLRVRSVTADTRAFTGLAAEVRTYDEKETLVSAADGPFTAVRVWKFPTVGASGAPELGPFGKEVTIPQGSVTAKICLKFAEATGGVDVDWLGITQTPATGPAADGAPADPGRNPGAGGVPPGPNPGPKAPSGAP